MCFAQHEGTITAQNERQSQRGAVVNERAEQWLPSAQKAATRRTLTCVCLPFPFEPARKSPPGRHQSQSRRGEPHPIQEPRFVAVRAASSLPLWSIIHIKERMKEKREEGGGGTEGKTCEEDTRRRGSWENRDDWGEKRQRTWRWRERGSSSSTRRRVPPPL